ncbi:MAG: hypothetical protein WBE26_02185 [Phycisphaerae bacterium]
MRKHASIIMLMVCFGFGVGSAQAELNHDPAQRGPGVTLDGGWAYDQISGALVDSDDSPYVFTLTGHAMFRITDQFITGDRYWVYDGGVLILTTAPFAGAAPFGDDAVADAGWTNPAYEGGEVNLTAGPHSITVQGDGAGGIPAGFYVRLDSVEGIPTVTEWGLVVMTLMLLVGAKVYFNRRRMMQTT